MSKNFNVMPPPYGAPPAAPPSYAQAVGGVPPSSPYVPNHSFVKGPEIVTTTVVPVGPNPTHMICPYCQAEIDTTTKSSPGCMAYISGAILCLIGCFFGCCLIPCCMDKCLIVSHTCPNCNANLGTYNR